MGERGRSLPVFLLALGLLLAGGLLSVVVGINTYIPRLLLVSGLAALVWGLVRLGPTLLLMFVRMRQVAEPGPAVTWLLLGLILVLGAVGLEARQLRFDLTARGLQSLSATSRAALREVHRPIRLVGVFDENTPEREHAGDALRIYAATSHQLTTEMIDPEKQPDIARSYRINFRDGILVQADSVREVVTEIDEEGITSAILRVCDPRRPVVAILEGHGETDPKRSSFTRLRENIARDGFKWRFLRLGEYADVPEDVRVILIPGPEIPLLPGEVRALGRFLDHGGRLGLFLDPGTDPGLEKVLQERGIAVQRLGEHEITKGLTSPIILPGATAVGFLPGPAMESSATVILKSARTARPLSARRDSTGRADEASERPTEFPLGVAVQWEIPPAAVPGAVRGGPAAEKPYARLVVIGDSDFLRDSGIELYGNRAFTNRMLGWLGEKEFLLRFPLADRSGTPLRVTRRGLQALYILAGLMLPLAWLGGGVAVWVRRR